MRPERLFEFRSGDFARKRQRELSTRVLDATPPGFKLGSACGLDAAYKGPHGVGVATIWNLENPSASETQSVVMRVPVEYESGLLGFREGPLVVAAARLLRTPVDVFIVDGHGRAHPRRFGLACHVGLALERPTIGVAKSIMFGRVREGRVVDSEGIDVGRVLVTGTGRRFIVSVGHMIGLDDGFEICQRLLVDDYLAPLRAAHLKSVELRRELPG